ncbi:MAG: hypothetical protein J6W16_05930 [Methanobrevibacter sp.]|nr:hypothetical protein [Methanobrevibacter sp.]
MKDLKNYLKHNINEDSLDDFDIDGKYAKTRNTVSQSIKNKTGKLIDKTIASIQQTCEKFFAQKGMKMKQNKYMNSDVYKIEYPDLSWGFTYKPENRISFLVVIGEYGHIEGIEKADSEKFLKEFANFICNEIPYLKCNNDIWKDSLSGIHGSASWIVRFGTQLKDLK